MSKIAILQQKILDDYGYPFPPTSRRKIRNMAVQSSKRVLGIAIYLVLSIAGFLLWLSSKGHRQAKLTPRTFHPRRILIIRLDLIGDLVLSLTVIRALKRTYPDAEIDLLALPLSARVVIADPDLATIIFCDPNVWRRPKALLQLKNWHELGDLWRLLRSRHYDLAVSVFGNWAAILAVLSGAKRRVGFGRESYPGFMTDSVPGRHWDDHDHKHEVDYCLELTQAAGATITLEDRIPHLFINEQAMSEIEQLLRQEDVRLDRLLIACHVSSNNGQSKRWPIPYWATLLDRLIQNGAQIVLTGAAEDKPLIDMIIRHMQEHPINLAGKTSLTQLAALLKRVDLLITGDSGPMHIAGAVGTPLIAIHGPTDPALSGPVSPAATILRSGIWCSPCYKAKNTADCPFYTTQCMKNILPTQVFAIVQQKLMSNSPDKSMMNVEQT